MREQIVALFDRFKVSNPFGDLMLNGSEGVQDEKRERERKGVGEIPSTFFLTLNVSHFC